MNFSALTNDELHNILDAFDAIDAAYDLLIESGAVMEGIEYDACDIADAIAVELEARAVEDSAFQEGR